MEVYSSLNDFQQAFLKAKKDYSDVNFTVRVEQKKRLFVIYIAIPVSNLETKVKLRFGDDETYILEMPISTYLFRLRLQHLEYLNFCENREQSEKDRKEKQLLELKKAEIRAIKEREALNYRQQQHKKVVIERLSQISPKVYSTPSKSGETVLASWGAGDGEYSMKLELIRIGEDLSIKDTFDLILEETSLNYGEYASTDSSYNQEILIHERFGNIELAVKRCEEIILDKSLFF